MRKKIRSMSQSYLFLGSSKRGRFEICLFLQTTTLPGHFLQKGGLAFEFGPRGLTDRVLVLASGYRVRTPLKPNFSNLAFFEVFRAETFKKGVGFFTPVSQTYPFLRFSRLKPSKKGRFEKFVFPNYHIPGAFSSKRRPFI